MPEAFAEDFKDFDPGIHEWPSDYMILCEPIPNDSRTFYLVLDNTKIDPLDVIQIERVVLLGVLIVTILSAWLGS